MNMAENHLKLQLRQVIPSDLSIFFEHQLDPDANFMAAFTSKDPTDRVAFDTHWAKVMADEGITILTILYEGQVAGSVLCHSWDSGRAGLSSGWARSSGGRASPRRHFRFFWMWCAFDRCIRRWRRII